MRWCNVQSKDGFVIVGHDDKNEVTADLNRNVIKFIFMKTMMIQQ